MKFFSSKKKEIKESPISSNTMLIMNYQHSKPKNIKELQKDGYAKNPTIYRCVKEIAVNAAMIPLYARNKKTLKEVKDHAILRLLARPNPMTTGGKFIQELFTDHQTVGNNYVARTGEKQPAELWRIDPNMMEVTPGKKGLPESYVYGKGKAYEKTFPVNQLTGGSQILHRKTVNPLNQWYGLPPLEVAAVAGDLHNAGLDWNYSLLKNGGRPSGALTTDATTISEDALGRLKEVKKALVQGAKNAGNVLLLSNGLKWTSFSENAKDMDFSKSMTAADKYIAMVYGVPLPLIMTDASAFNNVKLAQEKLYEDTIIPLFDEFIKDLNIWLTPLFGDDIELCYNLDAIPALEEKRQRKCDRLEKLVDKGIISPDEARTELGYEPRGGDADELRSSNSKALPTVTEDDAALKTALKSIGYDINEIKQIMDN